MLFGASDLARKVKVYFPNLRSMTIQFPQTQDTSLSPGFIRPSITQSSMLAALSPVFEQLENLEIFGISGALHRYNFTNHKLPFVSSFALTSQRGEAEQPLTVPKSLSNTIESALRALSPDRLTTLRLGTSDMDQLAPSIPADIHFPAMTTLTVEGFKLDAEDIPDTHTDLLGFITRHRSSLVRLNLLKCMMACPYVHLDAGKRLQAWVDQAKLTSIVQYKVRGLFLTLGGSILTPRRTRAKTCHSSERAT